MLDLIKIKSFKMSQRIEISLTTSVTCNHYFYLYAQHNTKQFLMCKIPLYKILKNFFQCGTISNLEGES